MTSSNPSDIKLAVYVERLDRYIETQSALNASLINSFKSIETDVEDIREWRSKMYGAKTGLIAVGFLIVHLVVIVGALTGINWNNR